MRKPQTEIASALSAFYSGMSIDEARIHLRQEYGDTPSDSTVYEWIQRFSDEASTKLRGLKPKVGDVWVADETVLDLDGHKIWFWDLIDAKTRFLLASHLSYRRSTGDAQSLVMKAIKRAGKSPKVILTDKLAAYLDGIPKAAGHYGTGDIEHLQTHGFGSETNTNLIERFHSTLKGRTKVFKGLKSVESAMTILDGWLVHYNFFKPHESLEWQTPAEYAGIESPYSNWRDVVADSRLDSPNVITVSSKRYEAATVGKPSRFAQKRRVRQSKPRKGVTPMAVISSPKKR
ncbi:DDE-type integrase/transposase/recombinase [Dehalogenimonas sp. THU2]|uniref:DDE-type integrase/transposase/recombinase n=1 Tax=Dehalogenimonas sp. THU2 TaxID=3151121 RepID=UPI0032188E2A